MERNIINVLLKLLDLIVSLNDYRNKEISEKKTYYVYTFTFISAAIINGFEITGMC